MPVFEFDLILLVFTAAAVAFLLWALWNFSDPHRK